MRFLKFRNIYEQLKMKKWFVSTQKQTVLCRNKQLVNTGQVLYVTLLTDMISLVFCTVSGNMFICLILNSITDYQKYDNPSVAIQLRWQSREAAIDHLVKKRLGEWSQLRVTLSLFSHEKKAPRVYFALSR